MRYSYKTQGTCSKEINFDINGNIITNVSFAGGCSGNLQVIPRLVDGMTVEAIKEKCKGILCVERGTTKETSCPDQLAIAVEKAYLESTK
jgi:uncharacterized protein (TIGR03905 family)